MQAFAPPATGGRHHYDRPLRGERVRIRNTGRSAVVVEDRGPREPRPYRLERAQLPLPIVSEASTQYVE